MLLHDDVHQDMPSESAAESICTDRPRTSNADNRSPVEFSSPVQTIPAEIFAEILSYLGPGHLDDDIQVILHTCARAAILPPTHVCQRWRQIALSTPSLWNRITVYLHYSDNTKAVECAETWLARGGDCPLFVKLLCRGQGVEHQSGWDALLATVIGHSCRWREASFGAPHLNTDLTRIRNRIPLLQTLRLALPRVHPPNAFEAAPMLRSVVDLNSQSLRNFSELPWNQLTDVTANCCSFTQAHSMLQIMPRIVTFTAELKSSRPASMAFLRLSHLRNLTLSYDGISIDCFFNFLELPSLTNFSFSEESGLGITWSTSLISLIHRSSCDIATLDLTLSRNSGSMLPNLNELIRVTPKLKTLDIHNAFYAFSGRRGFQEYSRLVQALTASPACGAGPYPAPELQNLFLDYWEDFQVGLFVDMVESRWRVDLSGPVKRIDSIGLRHVPDAAIFDAVAMGRMREFVAEGLSVRVQVVSGKGRYKLILFDE
ncbi:hypothetical protein FIBSPDRAFT_1042815 [Athelia psychrophila]|uniref:F-box domain-containing protein n=1 Tax=Athelia psychrophila TaxID=1759441 RepID=A0A166M5N9_9AGAM|nr:hypothetical protein FIBSPDRAFT_1042815 [Fibularhizoctonia sp. CBS 109695]